ncbi:MAG: hypothetical protein CMB06_04880 [Euryarchaeota archaeon]|nr:hypothetical protein [Euryarchaeota archaeon]
MGFFKKKEEKKKFDYSDDTKELFAERDAFYAKMRQEMGGEATNPELANQKNSREERPKDEDLQDLLGDSDFNPYASEGQVGENTTGIAAPSAQSSSAGAYVCEECGKEFQEKWGKCPSCGGNMKRVEAPSESSAPVSTVSETNATTSTSGGDPLDDLLGDFNSPTDDSSSNDEGSNSGVRMVNDDSGTDFGQSRSSHSNRKVRKVKKIKRPRKSL